MSKGDVWPTIKAERQALADDLKALNDEQWEMKSLCSEWTVRDVLAHMTATANVSLGSFFPKLISSGFSLTKMQAKDIEVERGATSRETLSRFEQAVGSSKHPPGPSRSWLGEAIVHAEDIRRTLGILHDYPTDAVVDVADFYKGSNMIIGAKRRISGIGLRATDTDWSHGSGPEVSGPILSLVMMMTGRTAALADLSGDGVAMLRAQI